MELNQSCNSINRGTGPSEGDGARRSQTPKNRSLQNFSRLIWFNRRKRGESRPIYVVFLTHNCLIWC